MLKYRWLKFRVTEQELKDAHHAYTESGERWFWQWCRKQFVKSIPATTSESIHKAKRFDRVA